MGFQIDPCINIWVEMKVYVNQIKNFFWQTI